jgi:phenylalanyl-tRNA synthetase beta subunit
MRAQQWEYKSVQIDVAGWINPDVQPEALDAALNVHGAAGWELVSAFDVNRGHGRTSAVVALFKRARP